MDGVIDLEDSRFDGDLKWSTVLHSENVRPGGSIGDYNKAHQNEAVCGGANLRMVKCANDVDICGLSIDVVEERSSGALCSNRICAPYLEVNGTLLGYQQSEPTAGGRAYVAHAQVGECLDLAYAKINHLTVASCMFPSVAPTGSHSCGTDVLTLERASVGKLEFRIDLQSAAGQSGTEPLVRGNGGVARNHADFPYPMNLADVVVDVWAIDQCAGEQRFSRLMENDQPFHRSTYRSLETFLRSTGDDKKAVALYKAMREREWREVESPLANLSGAPVTLGQKLTRGLLWPLGAAKEVAFRYLLRYGTNPLPLLTLVVLLGVLMFPAYRNVSNFEEVERTDLVASRSANVADTGHAKVVRTGATESDGDGWGNPDALQMVLKHHIPMVPLEVRTGWRPRDTGMTAFGQGKCATSGVDEPGGWCLDLAPEDVFNLVQLANWVFWPILLTYLIRRLLRQH